MRERLLEGRGGHVESTYSKETYSHRPYRNKKDGVSPRKQGRGGERRERGRKGEREKRTERGRKEGESGQQTSVE